MTETPTPLPCPFCGGPAVAWVGHTLGDGYIIACSSANQCHVHPSVSDYDQAEALTAWNTRADSHHRLIEALTDVGASLAAAISLLERGGKAAKKAAPSDRMFDQMVKDYKASLERARAALKEAG